MSGRVTLDHVLSPDEETLFQDLDGEAVLLDPETGRYYGLDEVGTRVWELARGGRRLSEIHRVLLLEFDVEPDVLERDLCRLAEEMIAQGLAV